MIFINVKILIMLMISHNNYHQWFNKVGNRNINVQHFISINLCKSLHFQIITPTTYSLATNNFQQIMHYVTPCLYGYDYQLCDIKKINFQIFKIKSLSTVFAIFIKLPIWKLFLKSRNVRGFGCFFGDFHQSRAVSMVACVTPLKMSPHFAALPLQQLPRKQDTRRNLSLLLKKKLFLPFTLLEYIISSPSLCR